MRASVVARRPYGAEKWRRRRRRQGEEPEIERCSPITAAAPCKMDARRGPISNCFPARSLLRTGRGGAGHWLVSQKPAQEERKPAQEEGFAALVCSASAEERRRPEPYSASHRSTSCPSSHRTSHQPQCVLDAAFLIKTHRVRKPSDLCAVDVSDRNLTKVRAEDFVGFSGVAYVSAAENTLALENFRTFPALRELELSMNGIRRIRVKPGDFPHVQVLDLSYNYLTPDDITQLGVLPRLRVLCLTGNDLTELPSDLTAPPANDPDWAMFSSLEILMLDDNKLTSPAVFESLAGLKSLRQLNLDSNRIRAVPYLHQSHGGSSSGVAVRGTHTAQESESQSEETEEKLDYVVLSSTKDPDRTEVIFPSISSALSCDPLPKPPDTTLASSNLPSFLLSSAEKLIQSFLPPLPSLTTLSLANNKIAHEEDLLAAALFPSLEELVIYGNPLTTQRKGDPRLLKSFLHQRLGVKITRKKMPDVSKPQLIIPVRDQRKVKTFVPKIPKHPLMIEPPLTPFLRLPVSDSDIIQHVMSSRPLPPIRASSEKFGDVPPGWSQESISRSEASEEGKSFSSEPAVESFFMTQIEDPPEPQSCTSPLPTPEEQDGNIGEKLDDWGIPEKFRGYEELYKVEADPDFLEPVGIQSSVRALQHALRHLLLYQDYKPSQSSIQRLHPPLQSQPVKELHSVPWRSKKEVVVDALTSMRERRHLVEVPLDLALQKSRGGMERGEARRLLRQLHHKYQFFHAEVVKRAAELEADLWDTTKQLLEAQGDLEGPIRSTVET